MKKIFSIVIFTVCSNVILFSLEETWVMIGVKYDNYFDIVRNEISPVGLYMGNIGGKVNTYKFWEGSNVGLYLSDSVTVPALFSTESHIYDYNAIQNEAVIGFGFRTNITDKLLMYGGIGFSFIYGNGTYNNRNENLSYMTDIFDFGIAGDIGLKLNFSKDRFFISFGAELSYHFVNHTSIASSLREETKWAMGSLFGVKPYICFGVNFYNTSSFIGGVPK